MKYASILLIAVLITACGGPKPIVDYDPQASFSTYNTYAIFPNIETNLSQLDDKRLFSAIDQAMQANGFTKAENPDVYINVFTSQFQDVNRNRIGIGVGGGGGNVGVGVSGGIPIGSNRVNYLKLTFDIINRESDDLVWQAIIEERFNANAKPAQRQEFFNKAVQKILRQYPPK